MYRFNNDYNHGAHPAILKALQDTNDIAYGGYGLDPVCEQAERSILRYVKNPQAKVHFLLGGTQVNYTVIAAALRPFESVICADSGHIHVHETGAVENTGHKIEAVPGTDGKITAAQVEALAENFAISGVKEHITEPKLVYISFPTEFGTLYTKQELTALREVCDRYHLYLFLDGARLGYGLGSPVNDVTLEDLGRLCDAFYIGGTKCGALFGEALVLCNPALQYHFRSYIKQNGAMLAKGWLLGLQFETLFADGLYLTITRSAVDLAMRIKEAFASAGIPAYIESFTNQQFVVVTPEQRAKLAENFIFEEEGSLPEDRSIIRFCTSWSSTEEEVEALVKAIGELS